MEKKTNALEYEYPAWGFKKLGAVQTKEGMLFTAAVKRGASASVILYKKGGEEILAEIPFPEKRILGDAVSVLVKHISAGKYEYNFKIDGKVVQDPYARVLSGSKEFGREAEGAHGIRCGIPAGKYDWEEDEAPQIPYHEAVMYNLHVRGFTKQKNSGVRHKGTFLGLIEKADYLQELGINQIKLMPAYDFRELETVRACADYRNREDAPKRMNYWGYTRQGSYFAPKRAYTAGSDPVKEFKDMVKAMHRRGIEVLMEFYFGEDANPRYVTDCLMYWMETYHVDGFHLLGNETLSRLLVKDPLFSETKLLNLYFPEEAIYQDKKFPVVRTAAEANDGFLIAARRFLKGDESCLRDFAERMTRNPKGSGLVNYMTSHDGFTLCDLVSYEDRHNEENGEHNRDGQVQNYSWNCGEEGLSRKKKIIELRRKQMRNAFCMLLFSAGTPMLLAGDEITNSQGGNNNPYCLDNETSWIDWRGFRSGKSRMYDFVKKLIAFRKAHPVLHMEKQFQRSDTLSCGFPDLSYHGNRAWYADFDGLSRQIGMMYCGKYADTDEFLYIAYNMYWMEREFAIPHIPETYEWRIAIDTESGIYPEEEQPLLENERKVEVKPRTVMVFLGKKKDRKQEQERNKRKEEKKEETDVK